MTLWAMLDNVTLTRGGSLNKITSSATETVEQGHDRGL